MMGSHGGNDFEGGTFAPFDFIRFQNRLPNDTGTGSEVNPKVWTV